MKTARKHLKKHGYVLIKNFLSPEVIQICKSFMDVSQVSNIKTVEANPYLIGNVDHYQPTIFADSMLLAYKNKVQDIFNTELIPSYVFFRQYYTGSELKIHRDRSVCEFSATILIDKDGDQPTSLCFCDDEHGSNPVEVFMEEGDAIMFYGTTEFDGRWHYRPKVEQKSITQAFLHYVSPGNVAQYGFPLPVYRD